LDAVSVKPTMQNLSGTKGNATDSLTFFPGQGNSES
jgi:hypothetical protein